MRQSCRLREQVFAFDTQAVRAFFRARHGGAKSAAAIAAAAGVSVRCAEKWLAGDSEPAFRNVCRLIFFYGPAFAAVILPGLGWVSDAALAEQRARLKADIAAAEAALAALEIDGVSTERRP